MEWWALDTCPEYGKDFCCCGCYGFRPGLILMVVVEFATNTIVMNFDGYQVPKFVTRRRCFRSSIVCNKYHQN